MCLVVAAVALAAVAAPAVAEDREGTATDAVRILVTGDSVTHGSSGDWTWRYRLWQHLRSAGVEVDFVGPRSDLWSETGGDQSYADPEFDPDHAARWGLSSAFPETSMATLVETYQPDVVIEMLGVIDLIFLHRLPAEVASDVSQRIAAARAVDPGVAYVVAEGTQWWFDGVPALNEALAEAVAGSDGAVALADADAGYDPEGDTYDNSHANARGEVKIAAAVADALAELGVGAPAQRPLPTPEVGPRRPAVLSGDLRDGAVRLSWVPAPGATSQMLWWRDATASGPWTRSADALYGTEVTLPGYAGGRRYEFRVQPRKGDDVPQGAVFSNVVAVGAHPSPPSTPSTGPSAPETVSPPGRPSRVRARSGARCAVLRWARVPQATGYLVERRRAGGWRPAASTTRRTVRLAGLPARPSWRLRVRATSADVVGEPTRIVVKRAARGRCR